MGFFTSSLSSIYRTTALLIDCGSTEPY